MTTVTVSPVRHTVTVSSTQQVVSVGAPPTVTVASPGPQGSSSIANAFDVTDVAYGAVGDRTVDDTAAILAAIDAAHAAYVATGTMQEVWIPPGSDCRVLVTASTVKAVDNNDYPTAVLMKSGVHLVIDGGLYAPFVGSEVWGNWPVAIGAASTATNWKISGAGCIDGGESGTSTEFIHQGIQVSGSARFSIEGIEVKGFRGDGIRCDRAGSAGTRPSVFKIKDCYVHDCAGQAVEVNQGQKFQVKDCWAYQHINFDTGGGAEAFWINGDDWTCSGNSAHEWGSSLAITAYTTSRATVTGNVFDDEIVWSTPLSDVAIQGNTASEFRASAGATEADVTIQGNIVTGEIKTWDAIGRLTVEGNTAASILVVDGEGQVTVTGNAAESIDVRTKAAVNGNTCDHMFLTGADSTATGNNIDSATTSALTVGAPRVNVTGGRITTTAAGEHAIKAVAGSTIDNCFFSGIMISAPVGGGSGAFRVDGAGSATGIEQVHNKILAGSLFGIS